MKNKNTTNYVELTDDQLSKLDGKRLLSLKNRITRVIGLIRSRADEASPEYQFDKDSKQCLLKAQVYKNKILNRLKEFGNITK